MTQSGGITVAAEHPNIALMSRLDLRDLAGCADLFAQGFIWHFVNPKLPEIQGDYYGVAGLGTFFQRMSRQTGGTFSAQLVSAIPFGDEFVVTHVRDTMKLDGAPMMVDAVVVWRIVDSRIAEAWDIPAINTAKALPVADAAAKKR